jgi:hypothetical protein
MYRPPFDIQAVTSWLTIFHLGPGAQEPIIRSHLPQSVIQLSSSLDLCPISLQLLAVPKALIENILFWDVFNELSVTPPVLLRFG